MRLTCHDVVLELSCRRVHVAGELVTPEPKVFDLLAYLMQNPRRVVSKQELLDSLWWGEIVGDGVLTRCISCLRKLLADDARSPRFIRTAHRSGYEFVAPVVAHDATVDASAEERAPSSLRAPKFVGRRAELASLRDALGVRSNAPPSAWLVRGEPGVGKTRLLVEAARTAPSVLDVHWARGSNSERSPFSLWRRAVRSLVRSRTLKQVSSAFRAVSTGMRRSLVASDAPAPDPALGASSDCEFRAVLSALSDLARSRPLALLLDDLHAADPASLALLEFVVTHAEEPLVVIGAFRDTEPCADPGVDAALTALRRACPREIVLEGLSGEDVRAFLACATPAASERLLEQLSARSGGNPAFLSELAASGGDELARAPVPAALRTGICDRLRALPRETRSLLELASIPVAELRVEFLARATEHTPEHCRRWLEPAERARWIVPDGYGRFRFAHGVVREIVYDAFEPEQRCRAHLALWAALADAVGEQNPRLRRLLKAGAEHAAAARACLCEAELLTEAANIPDLLWSAPFGDRLARHLALASDASRGGAGVRGGGRGQRSHLA